MKKCAFKNLGCKVNACELEAMMEQMESAGFEVVPFDEEADVYVIHTCSVTNVADKKSRQMIRHARRTNPGAIVVAVGCSVQASAAAYKEAGDADILIGTNKKSELAAAVSEYMKRRGENADIAVGADSTDTANASNRADDICLSIVSEDIRHDGDFEEQHIEKMHDRDRAYVKIEDGCDRFCSYCRIPYVRGTVRSRSLESIHREIAGLAAAGCKEFVITGIDMSSYGKDLDGVETGAPALAEILKDVAAIEGVERIRFGSLEPGVITRELLEAMADCGRFCPQFHLSMQSGCDTVLKRMNRHYTTDEYFEKCTLIRSYFENAAITTDIIAGFPGETEEEHEQTLTFVKKVGFSRIHAFPYSRREETVASRMAGQLPEKVKKARAAQLIALGEQIAMEYARSMIGREVSMLVETVKADPDTGKCICEGYTEEYIRAYTEGDHKAGDVVREVVASVNSDAELLLSHYNV